MRRVIVDFDINRNPPTIVSAPMGQNLDDVADMEVLCNGLIACIHGANQTGVQPDYESMKYCIDLIKKGFVDTDLQTISFDRNNQPVSEKLDVNGLIKEVEGNDESNP